MDKINIKDVGPIKKLSIPVPDGGGLMVLTGGQGSGKSTALRAVSKTLGGSTRDLSPRDNMSKGEVWLGDAKLTVSRARQSVKGELEIESLEGRFDISKLVDPGIQDPLSADSARIKAILSLSGAQANAADFYEILGGQDAFDDLGIDSDTSDPIVLAGRLNRALQASARKLEKISQSGFAAAKVKRDEASDVDIDAESDRDVLQQSYDDARDLAVTLNIRQAQYESQQAAVEDARQTLGSVESVKHTTVGKAYEEVSDKQYSRDAARKQVDSSEAKLILAKRNRDKIELELAHVQRVFQLAESHEETVEGLKQVIESAELKPVDAEQFTVAEDALAKAQEAIELGVKARDAKLTRGLAAACIINAEQAQDEADRLREKSKDVDQVLSDLMPEGSLRIDEGRLIIATDRSSSELYAELSDGERAALAIEVAVANLPPDGLLIAPQWMWEGWTKSTRDAVDAKLREHGVVMLTAEAVDGELAAELYGGESHEQTGASDV